MMIKIELSSVVDYSLLLNKYANSDVWCTWKKRWYIRNGDIFMIFLYPTHFLFFKGIFKKFGIRVHYIRNCPFMRCFYIRNGLYTAQTAPPLLDAVQPVKVQASMLTV